MIRKWIAGVFVTVCIIAAAMFMGATAGYVIGRTGTATAAETKAAALATLALAPASASASGSFHLVEVCENSVARRYDPIRGVLVPTTPTVIADDSAWLDHRELVLAALGGSALITLPKLGKASAPESMADTASRSKSRKPRAKQQQAAASGGARTRDHLATLFAAITGYTVGYNVGREDRTHCNARLIADYLEQLENWKELSGWYAALQLKALSGESPLRVLASRTDAALTGLEKCAPEYQIAAHVMRDRLEETSYAGLSEEDWKELYWLQSAAAAVQALVPADSGRPALRLPPPCASVRSTLAAKLKQPGAPFDSLDALPPGPGT